MEKYHINPETGRPNKCTAFVKDCKYSTKEKEAEHYTSKEAARAAYEEQISKEFVTVKTARRTSYIPIEFYDLAKYQVISRQHLKAADDKRVQAMHKAIGPNLKRIKNEYRAITGNSTVDKLRRDCLARSYKTELANGFGIESEMKTRGLSFRPATNYSKTITSESFTRGDLSQSTLDREALKKLTPYALQKKYYEHLQAYLTLSEFRTKYPANDFAKYDAYHNRSYEEMETIAIVSYNNSEVLKEELKRRNLTPESFYSPESSVEIRPNESYEKAYENSLYYLETSFPEAVKNKDSLDKIAEMAYSLEAAEHAHNNEYWDYDY